MSSAGVEKGRVTRDFPASRFRSTCEPVNRSGLPVCGVMKVKPSGT